MPFTCYCNSFAIAVCNPGVKEGELEQRPVGVAAKPADEPDLRVVNVVDLMGNSREITLLHGTERYKLSITSKGKLILTK
jgi:hemin uptake protein HemP